MKKYFPIFIDLSDKKIVVIGGGVIASRRVHSLLPYSGQITVVAPVQSPVLQNLHKEGKIVCIEDIYRKEQISEADMVIAATNVPAVNHQVKDDCIRLEKETGRQILVNTADEKALCDFYFPGLVQTDDITIGISSGGKSPGLVKETRKKIEALLKKDSLFK